MHLLSFFFLLLFLTPIASSIWPLNVGLVLQVLKFRILRGYNILFLLLGYKFGSAVHREGGQTDARWGHLLLLLPGVFVRAAAAVCNHWTRDFLNLDLFIHFLF